MGLVLLVTCPLWCEGFRVVQECLGRDNKLSRSEALMEILYTTSQVAVVLQVQTALAMIQMRMGWSPRTTFGSDDTSHSIYFVDLSCIPDGYSSS